VNVSKIVKCRESVKRQNMEEPKPIKVDGVEKYVRVEDSKLYFIYFPF